MRLERVKNVILLTMAVIRLVGAADIVISLNVPVRIRAGSSSFMNSTLPEVNGEKVAVVDKSTIVEGMMAIARSFNVIDYGLFGRDDMDVDE